MTKNVIEAEGLTKVYGDLTAVNHVSLSVEKGALYGLLGPNGSGKSTMIKMLTGQIWPTAGSATVLGIDIQNDPVGVRERVGIIPEQETPPSFLTATEYLQFVGAIRKVPDIDEKAAWWFDFLDFADKKDVLCKDLSRGTRQKLMFAQAFIHKPGACPDRRTAHQFRPDHAACRQGLPQGLCESRQHDLPLDPYPRSRRGDLLGICDPAQGKPPPHRDRGRPDGRPPAP